MHAARVWQEPKGPHRSPTVLAAFVQMRMLRGALARVNTRGWPTVLAGDLNSLPGSEVHDELLAPLPVGRSMLAPTTPAFAGSASAQESSDKVQQAMVWQSSYAAVLGEEPEFTTAKPKFVGTLDYLVVGNLRSPIPEAADSSRRYGQSGNSTHTLHCWPFDAYHIPMHSVTDTSLLFVECVSYQV